MTAYSAGQDNFWTAGTAQVTVTGDGAASNTFTVTDAPPCTVSVAVAPNPASSDKHLVLDRGFATGNDKLRVTLTESGPCSNLTVTLTASNGTSTFLLCSGACTGTLTYSGNDQAWPTGQGSVSVTGDATATAQFQVTQKP